MAGTTTKSVITGLAGSDVSDIRLQLNKAVDDIETLRTALALANTKINAIVTAAATDIAAVAAVAALVTTTVDAAGDMTAAKVGDIAGTTT
jgi:hypothetical protein